MSEKRFEVSFDEKIIVDTYGVNKNTTEYDIHKSCDLINSLYEENEQLRKIGVMYQGHNPCETCTYCLENKVCCAEPVMICDDAKENFVQGLCKRHKQYMKSIRRYDDE